MSRGPWIDHFGDNFLWSNATLILKGMAPYGTVSLEEMDRACNGQAPGINHTTLQAKGFTDEAIATVEKALPTAFDIKFAFNQVDAGRGFLPQHARRSGGRAGLADASTCWRWLGFTRREIDAANIHVCGAMTVEGAPHLKAEHYPVFDCANPVRAHRQALSLGRKPHPHDGGGAALHLRRHFENHQHAE